MLVGTRAPFLGTLLNPVGRREGVMGLAPKSRSFKSQINPQRLFQITFLKKGAENGAPRDSCDAATSTRLWETFPNVDARPR
ncbi:MAG: hypothetical protein CM15mP60_1360 [Alphaproteobacteria bacterium]|nr:MAG: hypothetical protein CM15mP60_1360 [Alphaproteobacteria bacterium]